MIAPNGPNERDVARVFKHLKQRGLSDRDLERQPGCQHNPNRMTADDVSLLASSPITLTRYFPRRISGATCNCEVPQ